MNAPNNPSGASFYALGPEFEWLASAWDGFARDLAETSGMLRHIVSVAAADPAIAAESSGLAALESATDRLVRELVDDAARIRRTLATYEQADAAVHASATTADGSRPGVTPPRAGAPSPAHIAGTPTSAPAPAPMPTPPTPQQQPPPIANPQASPAQGSQEPTQSAPTQEIPRQVLWHPEPVDPAAAANPANAESVKLGALSRVRRDMLARAEHWTNQQVPYNQEAWHEGYRTDCSGYVSMCWGLRDSYVTSTIPQISHHIPKDHLRAGDVLVNTDVQTGHIILFDRWADYAHNSYVGFELTPAGTHHHVIPYPYFSGFGDFEPYRYNNTGD